MPLYPEAELLIRNNLLLLQNGLRPLVVPDWVHDGYTDDRDK